jgi:hypothetical protein
MSDDTTPTDARHDEDEDKVLDDLEPDEAEAADVQGGQRAMGARWPGQRA